MDPIFVATTHWFSEASLQEVEVLVSSQTEEIEREVALIESFRQPYPLRARDKPVTDGEVDSYG